MSITVKNHDQRRGDVTGSESCFYKQPKASFYCFILTGTAFSIVKQRQA